MKIIEEQAGFRRAYSTIDHIFTLFSLVQQYLSNKSKLYAAFVDFRKAFDSVQRNKLWVILRKSGVNGKLYVSLKGIYSTVLACVRDKGLYSQYFNCPGGVRQGCVLSPQLFSFFINELAVEMIKNGRNGIHLFPGSIELFLMLFADDVVLLSDTAVGLQNQLNVLRYESDRLGLEVNLDKTNVMVFRKGGFLAAIEKWWYGNEQIKVTNKYKYLGIVFTTKLSLTTGWLETAKRARRGVLAIIKTMRILNTLDSSLFWKMFDTQIEPILTYGAEVWGLRENKPMERVHTFAIKTFLSVPQHSSNKMCYGESGRYPLHIRSTIKCMRYWLKLNRLPMSRLCRQVYEMLFRQEQRYDNWLSDVKNVLIRNGFGIVWITKVVGCPNRFISEFKQRLIDSFQQNWHAHISENEKYQWYHSFKDVFQPEKYLNVITNKWHRCNLARFRIRTMGLQMNRRWFDVGLDNPENALCLLCSEGSEDEIHFLYDCRVYNDLRETSAIFNIHNLQRYNLVNIMTSSDEEVLKALALFISQIFSKRRETILNKINK